MDVDYREEPCRSALNRVSGMMFGWSLNADRRKVRMMPAPAAESAPTGVQLVLELEAPGRQRQRGTSRVA